MDPKEKICIIPDEAIISPKEEVNVVAMTCELVETLVKEAKLGDDFEYAPYVKHLLSLTSLDQLPSMWSEVGQKLFLEVMGEDDGINILPPDDPFDWITADWYEGCDGAEDPFYENAAILVVKRAWDDKLIPVYDYMRHRNGLWLNTESDSVHSGNEIVVRASRIIEAGEELFTSHNMCEDCGTRSTDFGTPEILRDYGIVEDYPQRWIFEDQGTSFEIDHVYDNDGLITDALELKEWIGDEPNEEGIDVLQEELERLLEMSETHFEIRNTACPENEWNTIVQFHQVLTTALSLAIAKAMGDDDACIENGECEINSKRFKDLYVEPEGFDYNIKACQTKDAMLFYDFFILEEVQSPYQTFSFYRNPQNSDTCFDIENTVQICTSYRPHYHEGSVAYASRFLPKVQRVLFVGGGDSMLLHEILKYPALEKVVGLELDQMVVRKSFKHFGSQPHWDNDKVEWWFGDATKSLLMLPKEYFGSFDLVLVDLSETVMSFLVTDKLDIMEALSLLLKEDGIFVKNEHYLDKLSTIFKYTTQIHWYDNPVICHQSMIMGSNSIDFSKGNVFDHKVATNWLEPLKSVNDSVDMFHDFVKNNTSLKLCKKEEQEVEQTIQEKSPGIIMIVEAENANEGLDNVERVSSLIVKALEKVLQRQNEATEVNVMNKVTDTGYIIVAKFAEGYVTARIWPDKNYCAFDIHLWSSFEKHQDLKNALLGAVDSRNGFSSYRVVAGGMFGSKQWKIDAINKGPRFTSDCNEEIDPLGETSLGTNGKYAILEESVQFIQETDAPIAVICGSINMPCPILQNLENIDKLPRIVPFYSCSSIENKEYTQDFPRVMFDCEQEVIKKMTNAVGDSMFSAFVFDESISYTFAQVLHRVLKNRRRRKGLVMPNATIIALIDTQAEQWTRNFLERFLTDIFIYEPAYRAVVTFNENSNIEFHVVVNDEKFVKHLQHFVKSTGQYPALTPSIDLILGGAYVNKKSEPPRIWLPKDYDRESPLHQWTSQQPLGQQTIFQFESKSDILSITILSDGLTEAITSMEMNIIDTVDFETFDDLGEGCLLVAIHPKGSITLLWDGRTHVDINIFMYVESLDTVNDFEKKFISEVSSLKAMLRDEQPRGTGRVVNFLKDIEPRTDPHWVVIGDVPHEGPVTEE